MAGTRSRITGGTGAGLLSALAVVGLLSAACSSDSDEAKPAGCADVQAVFVPGTNETSPTADPNVPQGLLKAVADPLRGAVGPDAMGISFVPYIAQFGNPTPYPESQAAGVKATRDLIQSVATKCPSTKFALTGYSQGAAVTGDVATQIGNGEGPVEADKLVAVALLSDPNRSPSTEKLVGPPVEGAGLAGPRAKDFGEVADRVVTFCAPGDLICATPEAARTLSNIPAALAQVGSYMASQVHSSYASYQVEDGKTATAWTAGWLQEKISKS
ncbi:cutinase family protein [Rhodococcus sp. X156]|uniref:cutinase family protein n=1 Tax=Rhodococcus sp. X156 TaxID=2499145 RepID=UPI0013E3CED6|nr:cutinase family protein [Rhodococcus sp. X156]